jgi:hypothetical protein
MGGENGIDSNGKRSMNMERFAGLELRLDTPKGTEHDSQLLFISWFLCFTLCCALAFVPQDLRVASHRITTRLHPQAVESLLYNSRKACYFSCGDTGWDGNAHLTD